jgi:hypothetical protein
MKPIFTMSDSVYQRMLDELNKQYFTEKSGEALDMDFITDDVWLPDTAVIDNLFRRRGTWEVHLLFAHHKYPLKFLSRRITSHACPKRAAQMGFYMRRLAAKDQRGTLYVNINDLNLPLN